MPERLRAARPRSRVIVESAKRLYARAGLTAEWEETVRQLRFAHRRKTGFLSRLEAVAAGHNQQPSFLECAKARWGRKRGEDPA